MKICIDVSVLIMAAFVTGIQRVTREIACRLAADTSVDVVLLFYHARKNVFYQIDRRSFLRYYTGRGGIKEGMMTRRKVALSEIGKGVLFFDLDAAWMCRVRRSYLLPILKKQGAVIVAHIYDAISVTHPQYCMAEGVYHFMDYIGAHLTYADAFLVNAKATADELKNLADRAGCKLPPCTVVPLGADFYEKKRTGKRTGGCRIRKGLAAVAKDNRPYLLMVGTIEPRKNHKLLLQAYDRGLRELGYSIVYAGYLGWNMEVFAQDMKSHPDYGKRIFHFSGLNDQEISFLYAHARFLVFCSYVEGFGLPVAEALLRGTPVLAADIPVTREAAGDYCVYFSQDDVCQICEKVAYFENHKKAYQALRQRVQSYRPVRWQTCYRRMKRALYEAPRKKKGQTKTGIVIPSLNQGNYIEEALRSVIANKRHADIRLAVMDGGSTDQTLSIIRKYEDQIDLWRSEPDGGQADAINKGMQALCDCEYLMWLNADDRYEDEYAVKKITDYAIENGLDVCYGRSHFIDENGRIIGEYPVEPFCQKALSNRCFISQPGVLFSRRAYVRTGPLNDRLRMCLDYEYWIRLARRYEFGFVKEYIGATRMHAQTKTATMQAAHLCEAIYILDRYYGKTPMHWLVTKALTEHPHGWMQKMPKRLLMLLLYPWKEKMIRSSLREMEDG